MGFIAEYYLYKTQFLIFSSLCINQLFITEVNFKLNFVKE